MFVPRYVKHGKLLLRHGRKFLHYKRDILSEADLADVQNHIGRLQSALRSRDERTINETTEQLDHLLASKTPVTWETHWRENCEVILVAILVAVGIRSYFLQPFKIPTGSMQPTLNGIIGYPSSYRNEHEIPVDKRDHYEKQNDGWYLNGYSPNSKPNLIRRIAEYVILGRNYIDVVSKEDDEIVQIVPKKFLFFFTFSRIICERQNFLVYAAPETLRGDFHVVAGSAYKQGDIIARGAIDTGDQVFVDKFSYNFVKPHNGDVFVFRTDHIFGIAADPQSGAPFFIKRLAGLPNDTLRIEPPLLYINGKIADGLGFKRVMAAKGAYRGYDKGRDYLARPDDVYNVPAHGYFALGDNSYNSLDSRYWGPVPEENLVGRGLLVYWPFNRHWGIIR
jgi:signal peptidase I